MNMMVYSIVLLGSPGVGKSALMVQYIQNLFFDKYIPTIEDVYKKVVGTSLLNYEFQYVDMGGGDSFEHIIESNIKIADGIIMVYAINSIESFEELLSLYERVIDVNTKMLLPCLLVGNKCDLYDKREVEKHVAKKWADDMGIGFYETSAKNNLFVIDMFDDIMGQFIKIKDEEMRKPKCSCVLF